MKDARFEPWIFGWTVALWCRRRSVHDFGEAIALRCARGWRPEARS